MSSNGFSAGWEVEWRKLIASPATRAATTLVAVGIVVLAASMAVAAGSGNEMVLSQLGPLADAEGWELLVGASIQIGATAGLLGFGVSLSWMVGREFADGTIHGLFAIPVSRETLAAAKLAVYLTWTAIVAVMLVALLLVAGLLLGFGSPDEAAIRGLGRLFTILLLSGGLAVPAAWAATLGRGLLAGITTTILVIVIAQVMVIGGAGAWFPVAAPALWGVDPNSVSPLQLALVLAVPLIVGWLTTRSWRRLQLDR